MRRNVDDATFFYGRTIKAYMFILECLYGLKQHMNYPLAVVVKEEATGLERHFAVQLDFRFVRPEAVGEPIVLSEKDLELAKKHISQPETLRRLLPPERFRLTGVTILKAVEVTTFETISALSRDLIDQETVMSQAGFLRLQERLRTYFGQGELVAGVAAVHQDQVIILNLGCRLEEDSSSARPTRCPRSI